MKHATPYHFSPSFLLVAIQIGTVGFLLLSGPVWAAGTLALMQLAGVGLGLWAIVAMRIGNFLVVPEVKADGILITRGPYRRVRHPMYTALLLVTLAMVLNDATTLRLGVWGLLFIDLLVKLLYEEKLLRRHFPEYEGYMQQSWRLIPFLF